MTLYSFIITCIIAFVLQWLFRTSVKDIVKRQYPGQEKILPPLTMVLIGLTFFISLLVYPPIKPATKYVKLADTNAWLPYLPKNTQIDWTVLMIEAVIILVITYFLYHMQELRIHQKMIVTQTIPGNSFSPPKREIRLENDDITLSGLQTGAYFNRALAQHVLGNYEREEIQKFGPDESGPERIYHIYIFNYGYMVVLNNIIVSIESSCLGTGTPKQLVIGNTTIDFVLNIYGSPISQSNTIEPATTTLIYGKGAYKLTLTFDAKNILSVIHVGQ